MIRIFVASHKLGPRLGEGLYELIHVGRAVFSCQEAMAGIFNKHYEIFFRYG